MKLYRGALLRDSLIVVSWTAVALLAGAVAWSAVARLGQSGDAFTSGRPLRHDDVLRALSRTPTRPTSAAPAPRVTPPLHGRAVTRSWRVVGGTAAASCRGSSVELVYAAPSDGWAYRRNSAPRELLAVEFVRPGGLSQLVVRCVGGAPVRTGISGERAQSSSDGEGSGE